MRNQIKTLSILFPLALSLSANAAITMVNSSFGSATTFPTFSISGFNGSLAFQSVLASPAGATLQGGIAQGAVAVGTGWGETFNWTGGADTLSAISIIDNGGGGVGTYQPFLFDLGTGLFNSPSTPFNPSTQVNLFSTVTLTPSAFGSANFLEFDLTGGDAITLTTGHSYAWGLLNNNGTSDLTYRRANGAQSDPNGDGFTFANFSATTVSTVPYNGVSVRNSFIGIYTVAAVPEPSTLALLGSGLAGVFFMVRRSNKKS